ncbi:MAG: sugar ABC transporter substrate-binding protein [Planctomycetota bacterium]
MKLLSALGGVIIALLVGCSQTPSSSAMRDSDRPRVALIMKSLANEFFATMAKGAEDHQSQHSDDYELIINGIKDERDLSRQVALVEEMVAAGVDAIVIAPADSKALVPALRRAADAGIVVVNIDNRLDREILAKEGVSIPFVGPNNRKGAQQVAAFLADQLEPSQDQVGILEGIRTSFNAQQRLLGFQDAMNDAAIEIADSQSAQWEMSQANTIASSMLSEHPEITAILAANDSMALGAIAAVKSAGRQGAVKIVGFDNITAIQDAIREGNVVATADQHGDQLAVFGIEAALSALQGGTDTEDIETPVDLITASELADQL